MTSTKLQIQYGSDLYEIVLSNKDQKLRVEHVLDEIEKLIKVPKCHQSLIYKGQRLDQKLTTNLDELYIFNNSKLILNGTQKQYHDRYCCPDHDHYIIPTNTISSSQQTTNVKINSLKKDMGDSLITKTQTSLVLPKKQEEFSNPIGFTPEPNKNYE